MFVETFSEFCERQKAGQPIRLGKEWLFSNGARSNGELTHLDPPADQAQCVRLRHQFASSKLTERVATYRKVREGIETQATYNRIGAGPPPAEGWQTALAGLAKEIEALKTTVADLESQFPPDPRVEWKAAEQRQQQLREQRFADDLQALPNY